MKPNAIEQLEHYIQLDGWDFVPSTGILRHRESGRFKHLRPKLTDILLYLVENRGRVVETQELLERFWNPHIATDHAVHKTIASIRSALEDSASNPRYLQTYPKRGYVLIPEPVLIVEPPPSPVSDNTPAGDQTIDSFRFIRWPPPTRMAIISSIAAILVAITVYLLPQYTAPSIAFHDISDTLLIVGFEPLESINMKADDLYLTEQLPGMLTSQLATLDDPRILLKTNTEEHPANVDYLLSGSIQRASDKLLLQIVLSNPQQKIILFSERFTYSALDVFKIQDEVVQNIVSALRVHTNTEILKEMFDWGTNNPIAYDYFLRARFHSNLSNHADLRKAIDFYRQAIAADRNFTNAYIGLSVAASRMGWYSQTATVDELLRYINDALLNLIRLSPDSEMTLAAGLRALSVEGNNHRVQADYVRNLLMLKEPPTFAYRSLASLLMSAKLYEEAKAYLILSQPEDTSHQIVTDIVSYYWNSLTRTDELFIQKKQDLTRFPTHTGVMLTLLESASLRNDYESALYYLQQLERYPDEEIHTRLGQAIISAVFEVPPPTLEPEMAGLTANPEFNLSYGLKHLIHGNVESGIQYWDSLTRADMRRLRLFINEFELFFPIKMLESAEYRQLLERLDLGIEWQHYLMQMVMDLSPSTGVQLHEISRRHYDNGHFLSYPNLWAPKALPHRHHAAYQ